jgi:flagellar assembly protein FliH
LARSQLPATRRSHAWPRWRTNIGSRRRPWRWPARAIAYAALERFPEAPTLAALESLAREIDAQPRLVLTADPALVDALRTTLEDAARNLGFEGAVVLKTDGAFAPHAFTLDFGDGQATYDPAVAAERVAEALHAALASEGLHAEPLIPGSES